jgi:hypothetical protein
VYARAILVEARAHDASNERCYRSTLSSIIRVRTTPAVHSSLLLNKLYCKQMLLNLHCGR